MTNGAAVTSTGSEAIAACLEGFGVPFETIDPRGLIAIASAAVADVRAR